MNDDQLLQAAIGALERGNAVRALEHLDGIETVTATAWNLRAVALANSGEMPAAQEAVQRGLSLDADNAPLLLLNAELLEKQQHPVAAEQAYLDLLRSYPTYVSGLLGYGWLLATNGDPEGAQAVLDRVGPHVQSESPEALALGGLIACSEGRINESRSLLQRGLEADPNSIRLHSLRAIIAAISGEGTGVMATHMKTAASINPVHGAKMGYEARYVRHWALAPSRLVDRVGTARLWLLWIAIFFGLRRFWPDGPIGWIALVYVIFALYTWIAPPILRRWLRRKGEL